MSWAEVFKINKNMKKALNEQLRDAIGIPMRIITSSTTYTPEKTGIYKIICVGAGGDGYVDTSSNGGGGCGGGGGVAIKTMRLSSATSYAVTIGTTASFAYDTTAITATAGNRGQYYSNSTGGTASGGDNNYTGTGGAYSKVNYQSASPGSVGVAILGLTNTPSPYVGILGTVSTVAMQSYNYPYGVSLLNYGGGGSAIWFYENSTARGGYAISGKPAAVIIIPLEMEE